MLPLTAKFENFLRRTVGVRTTSASSTGNVHNKLNYIVSIIASPKLTKASDTLRHSFDTERGGSVVSTAILAKLISDFSGTIRISFESKDSGLSVVGMSLALPLGSTTSPISNAVWNRDTKGLTLPLGSTLAGNLDSILLTDAPANTANYVQRFVDLNIEAGFPIIIFASLSATRYFKNVRFYYDFVTSTEMGA